MSNLFNNPNLMSRLRAHIEEAHNRTKSAASSRTQSKVASTVPRRPCIDRHRVVSDTRARAAFLKAAIWPVGSTLNIFFQEGTPAQQAWVVKVVREHIEPLVNLNFRWSNEIQMDPYDTTIRITMNPDLGAWSLLGTDALTANPLEPTMNLGWIDDDVNYDTTESRGTGAVVIHEFGHALGMIHEHSAPTTAIQWKCDNVRASLSRPPNGWDDPTIYWNVFNRYAQSEINGSAYDPKSIMHYWYPSEWICNAEELNLTVNTKLSDLDKQWLSIIYPK